MSARMKLQIIETKAGRSVLLDGKWIGGPNPDGKVCAELTVEREAIRAVVDGDQTNFNFK